MARKTLESPLDCKEIQPVHSKGDQSWVSFGRNDAKAETPVLWPPHVKSWLIGKDSNAGRDWGQEEKGQTEDEMSGWHHRLNGPESEWTPGVGDGQGGLACCDSWGHKESDTTEQVNWTDGIPLNQSQIQMKAPTLFNYMKTERGEDISDEKFEASRGWFMRWKERSDLHNVNVRYKAEGSNVEAAASYPEDVAKIIKWLH